MTKVQRRILVKGKCHVIEYAVCADSTCPAMSFLHDLARGRWANDPDAPDLPSDAQLSDHDKFLAMCKHLATDGLPLYSRAVNDLESGIWEFKHGAKRMTFYDTDGEGGFVPKLRPQYRATSDYPDDEDFWWFPAFDEVIRLGHCFPKCGARTARQDVDSSVRIREEDVAHDQ